VLGLIFDYFLIASGSGFLNFVLKMKELPPVSVFLKIFKEK
jgi:hypothetical protein